MFGTFNYVDGTFFEAYFNGYSKSEDVFDFGGSGKVKLFSKAAYDYALFYS